MERQSEYGVNRQSLSCGNLTHASAASGNNKSVIQGMRAPNIATVTAYNDMLSALTRAIKLLADKGYESDGISAVLIGQDPSACIPPSKNRIIQFYDNNELYSQHNEIENFIGRIKDWQRVATRHN